MPQASPDAVLIWLLSLSKYYIKKQNPIFTTYTIYVIRQVVSRYGKISFAD